MAVALLIPVGVSSAGAAERATRGGLHDKVVTVGSFDFAESRLLAEIYSQTLEGADIRVRRAFGLGPREFVAPALAVGLVEFVPEYAGTAVRFLSLGTATPGADVTETRAALLRALKGRNATALDPAPAQDANAFVVTRATAARYDLNTVSDLESVASQLTFGGPPECVTRPLCLVGLRQVYGLRFEEIVELDAGGPTTRQALRNREVDVALLFTTDPAISGAGFIELQDDRGLQPAENVTPILRTEVVDEFGSSLVDPVNEVSARLTTDVLRDLNEQVAHGESAAGGRVPVARRAGSAMTTDAPITAPGESAPAYHEPVAGPAQARHLRRRRRPSGAAPPLPRKIGFTGTSWLIASALLLVWTVIAINSEWARRVTDQVDSAILRQIVRLRTDWLTDVMDAIDRVGSGWTVTVVGVVLLVALMVFRRWRHLFTLVGAILVIQLVGEQLYFGYARPRPFDVTIIGRWSGFSFPAAPVAVLAMVLIGITYTLVPAGRARSIAKWVGEAIVVVFAAAELYLGTFHPFDIAVGLTLHRRGPARTRSGSSLRTRCSPSRTGKARPRTSTWVGSGAPRSARPCRTSSA